VGCRGGSVFEGPRVLSATALVTHDQIVPDEPIEVNVTVEWSDGFVEEVRGWVLRWSGPTVLVRWRGGRDAWRSHEVWLLAEKVRRVEPHGAAGAH